MAVAQKIKLKNTGSGIVVCCQLRWKKGGTLEIDADKYTESIKKLVLNGRISRQQALSRAIRPEALNKALCA